MAFDFSKAENLKSTIVEHSRSANMSLYHEAQEQGLTLSELLETIDPSPVDENGKVSSNLDAFERQLAVHEIITSGSNAITVEQFFVGGAMILMPEYILREIRHGYKMVQDPNDLIAVSVPANGPTVRPIYIKTETAKKPAAKRSGEGAAFPRIQLIYRDKEAAIVDRGRQFDFSYRVVRNQKLAEFKVFLWWIGAQLAYDEIDAIYQVAKSGDNTSPAAVNVFDGTAGSFTYNDLVHLASSFNVPASMTHILANSSDVEKILNMSQFQDPLVFGASKVFQKAGNHNGLLPVNARMVNVPSAVETEIIALDSRFGIRESISQPLMIEADKVIERKLETAVISKESVYTVMVDEARKLSDY